MRRRGFTLAELTMVVVVFSIFATALAAIVKLSLSYWGRANNFIQAESNARLAMSTICSEFRQAMHAPATSSDIVVPSSNGAVAPNFTFTTSSPNFLPLASPPQFTITLSDPSLYQQINYYTSGGALCREVTLFNSSGTATSDTSTVVVQSGAGGSLSLTVTRLAGNAADLVVKSQQGTFNYTLETQSLDALLQ